MLGPNWLLGGRKVKIFKIYKFDRDFFIGLDVGSCGNMVKRERRSFTMVDISKSTAAELAGQPVLAADSEFHSW